MSENEPSTDIDWLSEQAATWLAIQDAMPTGRAKCDGLCVSGFDVGVPEVGHLIAYPHPGCPLHDPDEVCEYGAPDRCLSPTHGQITLDEALVIRHRQARTER